MPAEDLKRGRDGVAERRERGPTAERGIAMSEREDQPEPRRRRSTHLRIGGRSIPASVDFVNSQGISYRDTIPKGRVCNLISPHEEGDAFFGRLEICKFDGIKYSGSGG